MFGTALSKSVVASNEGVVATPIDVAVNRALARIDLKLKKENPKAAVSVKNRSTTFQYTTYKQGNLTDRLQATIASNLSNPIKTFDISSNISITATDFTHVFSFSTPVRSCTQTSEQINDGSSPAWLTHATKSKLV